MMAWESLHATSVRGAAGYLRLEVVPKRGLARAVVKRQAVVSVNCIVVFEVRALVTKYMRRWLLSNV